MTSPSSRTIPQLLEEWAHTEGPRILDIRKELYALMRDAEIGELARQVRQVNSALALRRLVSVGPPRELGPLVQARLQSLERRGG